MPEVRIKRVRHVVFPILVPVIVFAVSLAAAEFIMRLLYSSGDFMMEGALKETRGIGAMTNAGEIFSLMTSWASGWYTMERSTPSWVASPTIIR